MERLGMDLIQEIGEMPEYHPSFFLNSKAMLLSPADSCP